MLTAVRLPDASPDRLYALRVDAPMFDTFVRARLRSLVRAGERDAVAVLCAELGLSYRPEGADREPVYVVDQPRRARAHVWAVARAFGLTVPALRRAA